MTATILHLIQLHIKPIGPTLWMRGDTDDISDTPIRMDLRNPVDRAVHLKSIRNRLAQEGWENVCPHQANGGLWDGEPADFVRTKQLHHRLLATGKIDEANALRAVVTHNVWYAQRTTKDTDLRTCPRCGAEEESLLHRLWTCKNDELCTHPDVVNSQNLIHEARSGCPEQAAFWLGGILPGSMLPIKPMPVLREQCKPTTVGDFARILRATGRCGVDGSGGQLLSGNPRLRTVGAGVGTQA